MPMAARCKKLREPLGWRPKASDTSPKMTDPDGEASCRCRKTVPVAGLKPSVEQVQLLEVLGYEHPADKSSDRTGETPPSAMETGGASFQKNIPRPTLQKNPRTTITLKGSRISRWCHPTSQLGTGAT